MNAAFREAFASLKNATGEDDVRDALHDVLRALGTERFSLEYALPSGRVDMAAPLRRVLIETKARDAVGPRRPGSSAETQKEQVERYLREARAAWLGDLFRLPHHNPTDEPRIFLTDGLKWWGYDIDSTGRLNEIVSGVATRNDREATAFLRRYVVPVERRYKPSVPDDLIGELLADFADDLAAIYRSQEGSAGVQTKIALWRESLRGAGIVPPDDEPVGQANLFVRHTVLVVAARTLKMLLRGTHSTSAGALHDEIAEGFTAWLAEVPEGNATIDRIAAKLDEYRWRGHTRDRLKDAYHKLIAKEERKEFGEYYTPDWLARKVVDETLDEAWMEAAIQAASRGKTPTLDGHTVLDPACGSGTFLFHAARRLHGYIARRHPRKLRQARTVIARLVVGIDVHPIAVEMAEATLEMALPPPSAGADGELLPQVFLGDAMQSTRRDDLSRDRIVTTSARGSNLTVPTALAIHPDADALTARLVAAAVDGKKAEFPELSDGDDRDAMSKTLTDLTRIVKEESNHVWVWHLRNISGPVRMARTKAGRIVANPPWLMDNDTPEDTRKRNIAQLRDEYGLANPALRRRGSSTRGDLAAVFAARVAHLYLVPTGKMGLVLPGGVLINQNWAPWRSGCWHSPENPGCHMNMIRAWGMDDVRPPPFAHAPSGSCVVFCERRDDGSACRPDRTRLKDKDVGLWSGPPDDPTVRPKASMPAARSDYLDDWRIGALSKPHGLFYVMAEDAANVSKTTRKVRTKESTRAPWRGLSLEAEVETVALRLLARPQALMAFSVRPDAFLIVPAVRHGSSWRLVDDLQDRKFGTDLPLTLAYWKLAGRVFAERRSEGAGETLLDNLNYRNTLSAQLESGGWSTRGRIRTKVVYNESGDSLKAARCSPSVIANQSLYWINAATEEEALYLCGVINAPCMAGAWRLSKTSRMHFDKSPWRSVPVPKFDPTDSRHRGIVAAAKRVEDAAAVASAGTAAEVHDDGLHHELDSAVASVLPRYANL